MDIRKENTKETSEDTHQAHHKWWIGSWIFLTTASLCIYCLIRLKILDLFGSYVPLLQRMSLAAAGVFLVLGLARYIELRVLRHSHSKAARYNFIRLIRILAVLSAIMIIVAFLFEHWYTAAVSLGLFSLILGFALQTPISSFIGWLYIIIRNPYKVGNRIQIGDFKGDVVEIGYLDTTLWEFAGDYLTNDLPSGRLIRFPNTLVLQSEVYNYSWRRFPYIWNEIPFHVAYESDFTYIEEILRKTTREVLGPGMEEKVKELKQLIEETPVDELTIKDYPFVTFRTNSNTWIEVSVNYLVHPKKAAGVRTEIIKKAVPALLQQPGKVMFPNSNSR